MERVEPQETFDFDRKITYGCLSCEYQTTGTVSDFEKFKKEHICEVTNADSEEKK